VSSTTTAVGFITSRITAVAYAPPGNANWTSMVEASAWETAISVTAIAASRRKHHVAGAEVDPQHLLAATASSR